MCFVAYAAHELRGAIARQLHARGGRARQSERKRDRAARDGRARRRRVRAAGSGCSRRCSPSPAVNTGACDESPSTSPRPPPRSLKPTIIRAQEHHGAEARENDRRPGTDLMPRRESRHQRRPPQHSGRPARCRHVHRLQTRDVHDREHRTGDPDRRTPASLPAVPATQPSPRPPADGVGLGLAIVEAIANAHDATVNAQAQTGGGLRIDINFPAGRR